MGFRVMGYFIPYYGFMLAVGLLAAGLFGYKLIKYYGLSENDYLILAMYALAGGMTGAKLLYLFIVRKYINWNRILEIEYLEKLLGSGFVYFGGFLGGILGIYIAGKIHKISVRKYLNTAIPCLPAAQGFGRIGCYLAGCCYGIPYEGPAAVIYKESNLAPAGIPLFPVQLLEAICCWVIMIFLLVYILRFQGGHAFFVYIISYSVMRFGLEWLRYDDLERGKFCHLSTSQWISLGCVLCVLTVNCAQDRGRFQP